MSRSVYHALPTAAQFAEKFVVAENWWRGGLLYGSDGCLDRSLRAGRIGIGVNGGIEQAAGTKIVRRVGWDDRSATAASAGGAHGIYGVRAHSTRYYRNER